MQKIDFAHSCAQTIIIVAPPEAQVRVVRAPNNEIVAFTSSEEFDRWVVDGVARNSIRDDVRIALHEVGCAASGLPRQLRTALDRLGDRDAVPTLTQLEAHWSSRRSFYRTWCARIRETPSAFLRRVRAIHARRLLSTGMTRKEAALTAGFSSVDQMRRYVGRKSD